jgi:hypothetical protein
VPVAAAKVPAAARSHAPVLVQLTQQRPGALLDEITVRADGTGIFDRPSGGVGRVLRDVLIEPRIMRRLKAQLAGVPAKDPGETGRPRTGQLATYIMRLGGRTYVAREGKESRRLRGPMRTLAALLYGQGISTILTERLGGVAGHSHSADVGQPAAAPGTGNGGTPPAAAEIVFFQRQGAGGATLDTVSVRADGTATHARRYGGAGGRFTELRLTAGQLPKLRRALRTLPGGTDLEAGPAPPPGGAQYLMRFHGRTLTGRDGAIAPRARAAVRLLDGYIDGIGVRSTKKDKQTHSP